jgi:LPS export ABC transporter protein LptC
MTIRSVVIAIVLATAVIASWLLLDRPEKPEDGRGTLPEAGYYLKEAVIEGMGPDGKRLYTLSAERILQLIADDSVELESVNLEYASASEEPWRLTADAGRIPADGDRIELSGNVRIEEMLFIGPDMTIVTTPELNVDLRAQLATTEADVRIERGNYLLTAVGLRADLKDRKLRLQSEVHGQFLP